MWHKYEIHVALGFFLLVFIGLWLKFDHFAALSSYKDTLLHHYAPFLIMIGALYIVASGIHITASGTLTPLHSTLFLFIASFISSIIGTTGASILLIRPFLSLNRDRQNKVHLVVFFIFMVSNIGGSLTPIGDPPLFLGFLNGVSFFWTLKALFKPMLVVIIPLLLLFYLIDRRHYRDRMEIIEVEEVEKFKIHGLHNVLFIFMILAAVIFSSVDIKAYDLHRDVALILIAISSYLITKKNIYHMNRFSIGPIKEVAVVFLAIFATLIPVQAMLQVGSEGAFHQITALVNPGGYPDPLRYFFITGMLSAFLDNAPTYLLFFHIAGGKAEILMTKDFMTLVAISAGAVFMGALTYIGNAPNLMVKAIAERMDIKMPSFTGYMLWSCGILLPILMIFGLIYFR